MFRKLIPTLSVLVLMLLDTAVVPLFLQSDLTPSLTYMGIVALALLLGKASGVLYGLMGGLLLDITVGYPMGMQLVLYAVVGYGCGLAGRHLGRRWMLAPIAGALASLIRELVLFVYLYLAGSLIDMRLLVRALGLASGSGVLAFALYYGFLWLIKPASPRYALR